MDFSDCYVIFSPKRGIKKYITPSVIAPLCCDLVIFLKFVIAGKDAASWLSFWTIMIPNISAACLEMYSAEFNTAGIASMDRKKTLFLRTIPNMEQTVKNAVICDEIKRILLCVMTCGLSGGMTVIFGYCEWKNIICAYIYQAALMYIVITVDTYIVKRAKNIGSPLAFTIEYIWFISAISAETITALKILFNMARFSVKAVIIVSYAAAAIIGAVCFRSCLKRMLDCRYSDRKIKERT